jgi:integrase
LGKPQFDGQKSVTKGKIEMTGKLTARSAESLAKRKGRWLDGGGLFLRVLDPGHKVYWTYRYRLNGKDREMSVGSYPAMSLALARIRHAELRAEVLKGVDPVGDRRKGKATTSTPSGKPTFGWMADRYIAAHEGGWKNAKHHQQWVVTLPNYCAPIRDLPVDQVDAKAVLQVLEPKWNEAPETMSRLRGRIEVVLAAAQVAGHIDPDKPNPARWKNWLDHMLPAPKKIGSRGHHAAMDYRDLPAFMARLKETAGVASLALQFTILTCARTSETLDMIFDEIDLERVLCSIDGKRMKMGKPHDIPLSDQALAILHSQHATRAQNPHVFPGRPMRGLSNMSMAMLMRRLGTGDFTVHGMRSAARSWMADQGVAFELAEACLAHQVGNAVVQAYQRSSLLERRRPLMQSWADFVTGSAAGNVVSINRDVA